MFGALLGLENVVARGSRVGSADTRRALAATGHLVGATDAGIADLHMGIQSFQRDFNLARDGVINPGGPTDRALGRVVMPERIVALRPAGKPVKRGLLDPIIRPIDPEAPPQPRPEGIVNLAQGGGDPDEGTGAPDATGPRRNLLEPADGNVPDKSEEERDIDADAALEGAGAALGRTLSKDASVRDWYQDKVRTATRELRAEIRTGKTPLNEAAAREAFKTRNDIMDKAREKGSAVGAAIAVKIKKSGDNFEAFQERKAQRAFGKSYQSLSIKQKTGLWRGIVESSGRDNAKVSSTMKTVGRVGRGLWVATAALAAYNVLESDDKLKTVGKEAAKIGGGVLGGMGGGALAGSICGVGAPLCSGVGVLVGGVAGAMGADLGFDFLSGLFEDDKK